MGLFSRLKQKNDTDSHRDSHDSGEFRSRAEEDSVASRGRERKSASSRRSKVDDPILPEKKRARRRLIGAVALALAAVIGLPMLLDSEPKTLPDDIQIKIPSKDKPAEIAQNIAKPPLQSKEPDMQEDQVEEIIEPVSKPAATKKELPAVAPATVATVVAPTEKPVKPESRPESKSDTRSEAKTDAKTEAKSDPRPNAKTADKDVAKPERKPEIRPDAKSDNKPDTPKPAKTVAGDDEAARAMAILEGKTASVKSGSHPTYLIQVAALATQEKVDDLQSRLKAAGIASHTQKIAVNSGNIIRVRVGPFESKDDADKMRAKLAKLGLNGSLVPN